MSCQKVTHDRDASEVPDGPGVPGDGSAVMGSIGDNLSLLGG